MYNWQRHFRKKGQRSRSLGPTLIGGALFQWSYTKTATAPLRYRPSRVYVTLASLHSRCAAAACNHCNPVFTLADACHRHLPATTGCLLQLRQPTFFWRSSTLSSSLSTVIRQLYKDSNSAVKIDGDLSSSFQVQTGARQGCILPLCCLQSQ